MNFKDMVAEDISGVFLNLQEFGDKHTIGKKKLSVLLMKRDFKISKEIRLNL